MVCKPRRDLGSGSPWLQPERPGPRLAAYAPTSLVDAAPGVDRRATCGKSTARADQGSQFVARTISLEGIADEFRGLAAAAAIDGKSDVLLAKTCKLELGVSWLVDGEGSIKFWVLELGAGVSREHSQKVTVEMTLNPAVPLILRDVEDGGLSPDEIVDWSEEQPETEKDEVTSTNGGMLRLAFMLERLADEFRRAQAGAAGKKAILSYDKVALELTGTTTVEGEIGAKFWVLDLAASASREETQTITVEMTPTASDDLASGGLRFFR